MKTRCRFVVVVVAIAVVAADTVDVVIIIFVVLVSLHLSVSPFFRDGTRPRTARRRRRFAG